VLQRFCAAISHVCVIELFDSSDDDVRIALGVRDEPIAPLGNTSTVAYVQTNHTHAWAIITHPMLGGRTCGIAMHTGDIAVLVGFGRHFEG
jgi:hypothetical protein